MPDPLARPTAPAARLGPDSVRALARAAFFLGFVGAWCALMHLLTGRPVTPVPMLLMGAGAATGFAVATGERPLAASLNRWDEALSFLGLAALAHAAMRL